MTGSASGEQTQEHAYDAAGAKVRYFEDSFVSDTVEQNTIEQGYDGDGQVGSRAETRYTDSVSGGTSTTVTQTRYLRSTVLGGVALAEIDEAGHKRKGCVYAGGEKLAEDNTQYGTHDITWRLMDSARGGWIETGTTPYVQRRELDPLGADIGTQDPYAFNPTPTYTDMMGSDPLYSERGNPFDMAGGCAVDGMPASCSEVRDRMEDGSVAAEYLFYDGQSWHREWGGIKSLGVGLFLAEYPKLKVDNERGPGDPPLRMNWSQLAFSFAPQNTPFDLSNIKRLVDQTLSNPDCAHFMSRVLNAASSNSNPVLEGGNAAKIFEDFLAQKKGGLTREKPAGSLGYGSPTGRIAKGDAKIFLIGGVANQTVTDASGVIDELAHLAGSKQPYTDQLLATIVHGIPEYAALSRMKGPTRDVFDPNYVRGDEAAKHPDAAGWSNYFHDIQRQMCPIGK